MGPAIRRGAVSQQQKSPAPREDPRSSPTPTSALGEAEADQGKQRAVGPGSDLLEEVFLAVDTPRPGEAPVSQLHLAVCTLEAGAVPVSVQDLQDELVQDMLVAASALRDLCGKRKTGSMTHPHSTANQTRLCVDAFSFCHGGKDITQTPRAAT